MLYPEGKKDALGESTGNGKRDGRIVDECGRCGESGIKMTVDI